MPQAHDATFRSGYKSNADVHRIVCAAAEYVCHLPNPSGWRSGATPGHTAQAGVGQALVSHGREVKGAGMTAAAETNGRPGDLRKPTSKERVAFSLPPPWNIIFPTKGKSKEIIPIQNKLLASIETYSLQADMACANFFSSRAIL